ncbi:MAG: Nif3-like dinuclear metal center hexameric protein [Deltaproteobacteria bacterium]|nr:Nif3-like dinuclear metal center hexameric protein [Deltaproteobacteria bacterium]
MAVAISDPELRHGDLIAWFDRRIPVRLSEKWDNCGLQIGSRRQTLKGVVCCLDVTPEVVAEAREVGADFIFSHHPLFFKPEKNIDLDVFPGNLVKTLVESEITVYSAHTNLDKIEGGVSAELARILGVKNSRPLKPEVEKLYKLVTFVPEEALTTVEDALFAAGAGRLGEGRYRECAFRSAGVGSFFPENGSHPERGEIGRRNLVDEIRFETVCEPESLDRVLAALFESHPYEVPAYDLLALQLPGAAKVGLGRIGELGEELTVAEFAARVSDRLKVSGLRLIGGDRNRRLKRIALCGGSGFSLYPDALAAGADLYLTGDVKYHEAREVLDRGGMALLDAGHFATEFPIVEVCAAWCREFAENNGISLPVSVTRNEHEPWEVC